MKQIIVGGKTLTENELLKFSKEQLIELASKANSELVENGDVEESHITLDPQLTKKNMVTYLLQELGSEEIETINLDVNSKKQTDEQAKKLAKKRLLNVIDNANKLRTKLDAIEDTDEREQALVDMMNDMGFNIDTFDDVTTDLPLSDIINNIPVRVVEQKLERMLAKYKIMNIVPMVQVRNGMKQLFYKDFRDADSTSGASDVVIGDYNMGLEPIFQETKRVNKEIHKGFDIIDGVLNDITIDPSLFVSLVNDYALAIAKPIAKALYKIFITFIDDDSNYDEITEFTSADTKERAEQFYQYITSKGTTSRSNLVVKPNGSTLALEYEMESENMILIMNNAYASKYRFDLSANTFQLGEITIPVSQILVFDFAKLAEYSDKGKASTLASKELILYEKGVVEMISQYNANKVVDTPKLKKVSHSYAKVGEFRYKDKFLGAFKPKAIK